ncbi:DUF2790 domain-containing protein [Pseudomonas sp. PHC1]|uniref:DUF2790 domain-containing protein n=1 Tax=Pseudomonas sp. PHC1 TaxID=3384759 RepID=UPI00396F54C2
MTPRSGEHSRLNGCPVSLDHYNVAKVVSLTEPPTQECKVITADMKYLDNTGKPEEISYRKLSDACSFQN